MNVYHQVHMPDLAFKTFRDFGAPTVGSQAASLASNQSSDQLRSVPQSVGCRDDICRAVDPDRSPRVISILRPDLEVISRWCRLSRLDRRLPMWHSNTVHSITSTQPGSIHTIYHQSPYVRLDSVVYTIYTRPELDMKSLSYVKDPRGS